MSDNREKFEAAVVERLKQSGFLEIEIRTECLVRCEDGYQDEVINAGWHYWNAALVATGKATSAPMVMLDMSADELAELQKAAAGAPGETIVYGAPAISPLPTGVALLQDGTLNLTFVANALRLYANHIEGHPQRGDYFPADLRLAAEMLATEPPPPSSHVAGRWRVFEDTTPGYWGIEIEDAGNDDDAILYPLKIHRDTVARIVEAHNAALATTEGSTDA